MSFNIGVNILEVDGNAPPSILPAVTSIVGFIVCTERGPASVTRITSWAQYVRVFGGHVPADATRTHNPIGSYAVAGFFANGGTQALIRRLLPPLSSAAVAARRPFLDDDDDTTITVTAGQSGKEDPGTWGDDVAIRFVKTDPRITDSSDPRAKLVDLIVHFPGVDGPVVETWSSLDFTGTETRDAIATLINNGSRFVQVALEPGGTNAPTLHGDDEAPDRLGETAVSGVRAGSDGSFAVSGSVNEIASQATAALTDFEPEKIQLLACPETDDEGFAVSAIAHCAVANDRMFVGHVPLDSTGGLSDSTVREHVSNLRVDKSYGALYGPDILVLDPVGTKPRRIPPTGHVLGVYARTDRERGVWKAPAGDAARLRGALDTTDRVSDVDHTYYVKQLGVNLVRPLTGKGIVIDSARTLSTNSKWLYVNVRLLFNFVKSSLKDGLRWAVHEPNDEKLWGTIEHDSVRPFLLGLLRQRAFGPGAIDDVFQVKVDEDNNPRESRERGELNVEVYFYPSRPAETIIVRVGQLMGLSTSSDS